MGLLYSDCGEDRGQQERAYVDCNPAFDASCSSSEPHLLTQEYLNDFVRDLICSKK